MRRTGVRHPHIPVSRRCTDDFRYENVSALLTQCLFRTLRIQMV